MGDVGAQKSKIDVVKDQLPKSGYFTETTTFQPTFAG